MPASEVYAQFEVRVTSRRDEFESFFLANYDSVLRLLVVMTGSYEQATDATQEAFRSDRRVAGQQSLWTSVSGTLEHGEHLHQR